MYSKTIDIIWASFSSHTFFYIAHEEFTLSLTLNPTKRQPFLTLIIISLISNNHKGHHPFDKIGSAAVEFKVPNTLHLKLLNF